MTTESQGNGWTRPESRSSKNKPVVSISGMFQPKSHSRKLTLITSLYREKDPDLQCMRKNGGFTSRIKKSTHFFSRGLLPVELSPGKIMYLSCGTNPKFHFYDTVFWGLFFVKNAILKTPCSNSRKGLRLNEFRAFVLRGSPSLTEIARVLLSSEQRRLLLQGA